MTLITEALDRAARQVSISPPGQWITASEQKYVEIRDDFLLETADDILERVDLPAPSGAQVTIAGTGAETYALPADFKRLQRNRLAVYDASLNRPVDPITTDGEYTYTKDVGLSGVQRYYKTSGYDGSFSLSFDPAPTGNIVVSYVTKNWKASALGIAGSVFMAPDDILLFPRRLIESGIVWRWRERKGLPYQDKYMEYEALLARLSNDLRGRKSINFGGVTPARWQDMVPAFIPAS